MTAQSKPGNQKKIEELESIRGLAALLVVFFHTPKWNPILNVAIINNSNLMVDLFFVLSGFVIFNAYSDKILTQKDLIRFQFLRFGRLYPVHIIFLFAFVFIDLAKYIAQIKFGIVSPNNIPFERNNLSAFIKNIFLVQSVLPNQDGSFNDPSWSISVEFYTYLVFGLCVLYSGKIKIPVIISIAVISLVMLATDSSFGFVSLIRCFAGFFIGCLTSFATKGRKVTLSPYIAFFVIILLLLFLQLKNESTPTQYDLLIYFITSALIASLILSPENSLIKKILNLKVFTWLGAVSYSVYMSHLAIIWAVTQLFRFIWKRPEIIGTDGKSILQLSVPDALVACSVIVVSVLLVSAFVYNFVEKPLRAKSRDFAFSKI